MKGKALLLLSLLALSLIFVACDATPTTDPVPYAVDETFNQPELADDLEAQAVKASGIISELGRDDYPLTLFLTGEDNLETYLEQQGLTEEAFLAHPKLAEFYNSQLIYAEVEIEKLRTAPIGTSQSYTSSAGTDITLTKVKNAFNEVDGRSGEVNGVPSDLSCYIDYGVNPGDSSGMICYADAPIVENFDWSE